MDVLINYIMSDIFLCFINMLPSTIYATIYFHQEVINEIKTSKALYTLSFDEDTNDFGKQQLDLHLRWWRNSGVQNNYFCTHACLVMLQQTL